MSTEYVITRFLIIVVLALFGYWGLLKWLWGNETTAVFEIPRESIRDVCKRDLSLVGSYDDKLCNSLEHYLMYILVLKIGQTFCYDDLFEWNAKCNYDPDGLIYDTIGNTIAAFEAIGDEAERLDTEPKYDVDLEYDYTLLPKTLRYNDYCDITGLWPMIEKLKEGGSVNE